MEKSIIIGIDNLGFRVLQAVRELGADHFHSANAGFIYIDLIPDVSSTNGDQRENRLEKTYIPPNTECVRLQMPDIPKKTNNDDGFDAAHIRMRESLVFAENQVIIKRAFDNSMRALTLDGTDTKLQVYLVCALGGDTGSGILPDIVRNIREWTAESTRLCCFLLLPDPKNVSNPAELMSAYAVLQDLRLVPYVRVSASGSLAAVANTYGLRVLVDRCYMLQDDNQEENVGVSVAIAQRLSLQMDAAFIEASAELWDNQGENIDRASCLCTFGLAAVSASPNMLPEIMGLRLMAECFERQLAKRDDSPNPSDYLCAVLYNIRLTDRYLLGDRNIFDNSQYDRYEIEINNLIYEIRKNHPQHHVAAYLADQFAQIADTYRDIGIEKFYQSKMNEIPDAVQDIKRLLLSQLSKDLLDGKRGYYCCLDVLDHMEKALAEKKNSFLEMINDFQVKAMNLPDAYNHFQRELQQVEKSLLFRTKNIHSSVCSLTDVMIEMLDSRIGLQAYAHAIRVIDCFIPEIQKIREYFPVWRNYAQNFTEIIWRKVASLIADTDISADEFQQAYETINRAALLQSINEELLKVTCDNELPLLNATPDNICRCSRDWWQDNGTDTSGGQADWQALLIEARAQSMPALSAELAKKQQSPTASLEGIRSFRVVAVPKALDGSPAFKEMVAGIGRLDEHWRAICTDYTEQMVFLQEFAGISPKHLQYITNLQNIYDNYHASENSLHVHVYRRDEPHEFALTSVKPAAKNPEEEEALNLIEGSEEKFLHIVRGAYKHVKDGTLSATFLQMIESNRQRYGISQARADKIATAVKKDFCLEMRREQKIWEYRALVAEFLVKGFIEDAERVILIEKQVEFEIDEQQAAMIEESVCKGADESVR